MTCAARLWAGLPGPRRVGSHPSQGPLPFQACGRRVAGRRAPWNPARRARTQGGRSMRLAGARLGAAVLGSMLALSGCGGAPSPSGSASLLPTSTTETATASATTSTTATSPAVPEAAKAPTPEGAIAFTSYFFTLVNEAWTKPQAGLLAPHSTPACLTCINYENDAATYVKAGPSYDKTPLEVLEVSSHGPQAPGPEQRVDVVANQPAASVVTHEGKSSKTSARPRGSSWLTFSGRFRSGRSHRSRS